MLDARERERVHYHMGYLSVSPAAAIAFGLPTKAVQTLFIVDLAINDLLPEAEPRVRRLLKVLDEIEEKMIDGQSFLVADQIDDMHIRKDHIDALEDEYSRWASRLADEIGAPLYPGSTKFAKLFARIGGGGNIPVKTNM